VVAEVGVWQADRQVLEDLGSEAMVAQALPVVQLLMRLQEVAVVEGREHQQVLEAQDLLALLFLSIQQLSDLLQQL
jgi:hypothetical protein